MAATEHVGDIETSPARRPTHHKRARWAEDAAMGAVEFAVAQEIDTLDQAFRLVHNQYVWRHYMKPHLSGRRINLRHALPSTRVFVAKAWPRVISTVSVFQDTPLGLPMDELYKEEMDALRLDGRRICEISALAADSDTRTALAVLMRMLRMVVLHTAEFARLDDQCLTVNPRHVEFYERFFGCTVFGKLKRYATVNGAPAVALRLDLHKVRARIARVHSGSCPVTEIDQFLYGVANYRLVLPQLHREIPRGALTAEQFSYFFADSEVLHEATPAEREYITSLHGSFAPLPRSLRNPVSLWEETALMPAVGFANT